MELSAAVLVDINLEAVRDLFEDLCLLLRLRLEKEPHHLDGKELWERGDLRVPLEDRESVELRAVHLSIVLEAQGDPLMKVASLRADVTLEHVGLLGGELDLLLGLVASELLIRVRVRVGVRWICDIESIC